MRLGRRLDSSESLGWCHFKTPQHYWAASSGLIIGWLIDWPTKLRWPIEGDCFGQLVRSASERLYQKREFQLEVHPRPELFVLSNIAVKASHNLWAASCAVIRHSELTIDRVKFLFGILTF